MSPSEAPMPTVAEHSVAFGTAMATLHQEINKGSSVHSDGTVNWLQVEQLAAELLGNKGKHFQVVCYWGVARLHNRGFSAIAEAAEQLTHLVERDWDSALPPLRRLRGRMSAIEWWVERAASWIKQSVAGPLVAALPAQAIAAVNRFDSALTAQCDTAPVIYPLLNSLKQLEVVVPAVMVQPATVPPEPLSVAASAIPDIPSVATLAINGEPSNMDTSSVETTESVSLLNSQVENAPIEEIDSNHTSSNASDIEISCAENRALTAAPPLEPSLELTLEPQASEQTTVVNTLAAMQQRTVQQITNQVTEHVQLGNLTQAIRLLQQGQKALFGADRLQLTCRLAQLLHQAGHVALATLQMQQALALVEQHQLTAWDPVLTQQVLESAYDFFSSTGNNQAAATVLEPLSLLDAARVIEKLSTSLGEK